MNSIDTFVAFDIKGTHPDPESAEIVEIGAVAVDSGEIRETFGRLVRGRLPLPPTVARRMGIGEEELEGAEELVRALNDFVAFMGDAPLVAHDLAFQSGIVTRFFPLPSAAGACDLLEFARAVLPRLVRHDLPTLVRFFELDPEDPVRAPACAARTAEVYLKLLELTREKGLAVVQRMLRVIEGTESTLVETMVGLANELVRTEMMRSIRSRPISSEYIKEMFNVQGDESAPSESVSSAPLDPEEIRAMFGEGGPFHQSMPEYELRPQQAEMAEAVVDAFNEARFLVVEAGTGTGKSMAYLIPSVLWTLRNGGRVIVSTNTKNLQEQLFFKDLPELNEVVDRPFQYTLLKGRGNYLCLNRWHSVLRQIDTYLTPEERAAALPLVLWAEETATGDISENAGFRASGGLWNKVCSDGVYCRGQACPYYAKCFAMRVRRAALKSQIVVVNHSLLFSDLATEGAVLGEYEHLIFDEAHNIEKVAAQYLGLDLTLWRIRDLVNRLYARDQAETGLLVTLRGSLASSKLDDATASPFDALIDRLVEEVRGLWADAFGFFEHLTAEMRIRVDDGAGYVQKLRFRREDQIFAPCADSLEALEEGLARVRGDLTQLTEWMGDLRAGMFEMQDELASDLEGCRTDLQRLEDDLAFLTLAEDEGYVYWLELPAREGSADTRFYAAPLDVSLHLSDQLFDRLSTCVFTSATVAINGKFRYFLDRLGLQDTVGDRLRTLCVGSPFEYDRQALVCVPRFLPSPKAPSFRGAVRDLIHALTEQVRRGTLVLFTSYRMLNRSYGELKDILESEGILLLGQGLDGSRSNITAQFREDRGSVLFGTDSFWEGVDVPGEALEMLVIVKLPFAVPTEPFVEAQMERLEKLGKNPFLYYSVPEAAIRFRQGFGRLIRNRADRGAVVILDTRVLTTRYGEVFLKILPARHQAFRSEGEMIGEIRRWFGEDSGDRLSQDPTHGFEEVFRGER